MENIYSKAISSKGDEILIVENDRGITSYVVSEINKSITNLTASKARSIAGYDKQIAAKQDLLDAYDGL